jgi:uncharacterized membrane protein YdjX (TVP38/TMEM64 family)
MQAGRSVVFGHRGLRGMALLITGALLLVLAEPVHRWLLSLFELAEGPIRERSSWGVIVFVLLVAVSAMVAFVSSAVFVPVAIAVWGPTLCMALLWIGWFLGGLVAYGVGRFVGRPAVEMLVGAGTLARYEGWARSGKSRVPVLMLLLAIPSDMACYLFGLVRCRFAAFASALAVAEVPYALGAVYLATSFLERRIVPLLAVGIGGVLLSAWAVHRLHQRRTPQGTFPFPSGSSPTGLQRT